MGQNQSFNKIIKEQTVRVLMFSKARSLYTIAIGFAALILFISRPIVISRSVPVEYRGNISEVSIMFLGDIMQHMPQVEAAWNDSLEEYIYDSCFQYISPILNEYDLTIANLETTLAGKPYSGYPAFSSPDGLVKGLLIAGVDIVGTANNHCCDRGLTGILRTITTLDSLGLNHMGTYSSVEEFQKKTPLLTSMNGITLAFLNYTYGTNGIPVPEGTVVNLIDKSRIADDLIKARNAHPDKIIVFVHWGNEYERTPNAYQEDIARFLFDNGADIVIGSHPHVIQTMEWHKPDSLGKERLIAWSLGNCVSNQRNRYTDGGAMIGITLRKEGRNCRIVDANYQLSWVYNPFRFGKKQYYLLPVRHFENDTLFPGKEAHESLTTFIDDSRTLLSKNLNIQEFSPLKEH
jgi:poly-gamma-glutamate synthesis protein (capsule biosynthesis protein)